MILDKKSQKSLLLRKKRGEKREKRVGFRKEKTKWWTTRFSLRKNDISLTVAQHQSLLTPPKLVSTRHHTQQMIHFPLSLICADHTRQFQNPVSALTLQ